MNWGGDLTLIGAIREDGAPHLRRGDIVLLDNLKKHTKYPRSER